MIYVACLLERRWKKSAWALVQLRKGKQNYPQKKEKENKKGKTKIDNISAQISISGCTHDLAHSRPVTFPSKYAFVGSLQPDIRCTLGPPSQWPWAALRKYLTQDICCNGGRSKFANGGEGWAGVGWVIYPLHVGCEPYGWLDMDGPRILHFFGTLGRGSCAAACALSPIVCVGQARFLLERKDQADIFAFPTSLSSTSWHLLPCE